MMKQYLNWPKKGGRREKGEGRRIFSYLLPPTFYLLVFSLFTFHFLLSTAFTQSTNDAINLAATHSSFVKGLEDRPGWTAVAYDTQNHYGIWRVQFYDAEGNPLGWSDVNLEQQQVYAWETNFDIIEGQYAEAEEVLLNFARQDPQVLEMIGESNGVWIGFDPWREVWIVSVDRWPNSLELNIRSSNPAPRSLENLYLDKVIVQDIMSYEDWQSASSSQAVDIAFNQPEIATAVRGKEWTTYIERLEGNTWRIHFMSDETQLAEADINVDDHSVVAFHVN
jgi:hypothetical protein